MAEKLPQSLRQRLVPLFKEILAYHWVEDLTFNRLSGAVYHVLLSEENSRLTEDAAVDLAVNLTRRERLPELLARYDALVQKREQQAQKQVLGMVNNMIPEDTPNRAQVTRGGELADEVVAIEFGAATHDQWLAQRFGGQHLGDRAGRRHHDARATRLAQLPAQQRARGHHRAVGADALEGVGVPTGPQ